MTAAYEVQAAFLQGIGQIRTGRFDVGAPEAGEALVRVHGAGICGSDLHVFETGDFVPAFPVVPGHEVCGRVVAVGSAVDDLALGTAVALDSRVPCGSCQLCAAGAFQRCERLGFLGEVRPGGFAELVRVPRSMIFPLPDGLGIDLAVLAEPVAVGVHALRRALRLTPEASTALVLGAGPIGFVLAALLRLRGVAPLVVEPNHWRRERIAMLGVEAVASLSELGSRRFGLTFIAAGFRGALEQVLPQLSPGGCVAAVALHRQPELLPINDFIARELTLVGCHVFADEMPEALRSLAEHPEHFRPLLSAEIGLDQVEVAYHELLSGSAQLLKVVVRPDQSAVS